MAKLKILFRNEILWILIGEAVLFGLILAGEQGWQDQLAILRALLGLVYVLFIPGYMLQVTLFPHVYDLDGPERIALSFGFSVAIVAIVALVLDRLPWGIGVWTIFIAESVLLLLFVIITLWRRSKLQTYERFHPAIQIDLREFWATQDRTNRRLYIVLGVALVAAFGLMVSFVVLPSPADHYTEFYLLGQDGLAEDYPRETVVGQNITVTLGITNMEGDTSSYQIRIKTNDQILTETGIISLEDGENREQSLVFGMAESGDDQVVNIILNKLGETSPYRELHLFINVKSPAIP